MRSFAPPSNTNSDDLFVTPVKTKKIEKSKISKASPLIQIETDSSGASEEEDLPKNVKAVLSLKDSSSSEEEVLKNLIAPNTSEYQRRLTAFLD